MISALLNIFKIEELKKKVIVTLLLLIVYRIGCFIPVPGVNVSALTEYFERLTRSGVQTLFGILNLFTGGALTKASIFALGIMPYISSSIIMQFMIPIFPKLEQIAKEGKVGYERINQYTRCLTLFLCILQGFFISLWLSNKNNFGGIDMVLYKGFNFVFTTIITLTAGTIFIMWLGEQIQERGVGNGISLIIATGIVSRLPISIYHLWLLYSPFDPTKRQISTFTLIAIVVLWILVSLTVIFFTQAQRRIPIQYGKRVIGNRIYAGQSTYLPIRVDMAGIIAIILSQSVLLFPATIASFMPKHIGLARLAQNILQERGFWYHFFYLGLIVFFMYFHTAMLFNPNEIANMLKKNGGVIPGIASGKATAQYLDYVTTRIVFIGALYICVIAVLPNIIMHLFGVHSYDIASLFGGTTLLILVGVLLDTMKQIEGQLFVRHYDGFIKGGSLKARR